MTEDKKVNMNTAVQKKFQERKKKILYPSFYQTLIKNKTMSTLASLL